MLNHHRRQQSHHLATCYGCKMETVYFVVVKVKAIANRLVKRGASYVQ